MHVCVCIYIYKLLISTNVVVVINILVLFKNLIEMYGGSFFVFSMCTVHKLINIYIYAQFSNLI